MPRRQTLTALTCALVACAGLPAAAAAAAAAAAPPRAIKLAAGWEVRDTAANAPADQPAPPAEGEQGQETPDPPPVGGPGNELTGFRAVQVPSVFDPDAAPQLYAGTVKQYRLRFRAPRTRGYRWALHFEQVRRRAVVYLNGRRIGGSSDPYSPFELEAKGLRPGQLNELLVTVDSRKSPRLAEGWWNWGGINRPVTLVPLARVNVRDLGLLSEVSCSGPATGCRAGVLVDGILSKLPAERRRRAPRRRSGPKGKLLPGRLLPRSQPRLKLALESPSGRVTSRTFALSGSAAARRRLELRMPVPAPKLWAPDHPHLYDARVTLTYRGRTLQRDRLRIGLRSVQVKGGLLHLNNRRIQLRGASIHEDFPGRGAALSAADMDTTVRELQEVGANVTRSHYVLSEGLLRRLDAAGIMVWNQAPVWQRDRRPSLLASPDQRARAYAQVEGTVKAARNHPSVITHSVGNELSFTPDFKPTSRLYMQSAAKRAGDLDPTLPLAIDINGRPYFGEQLTYGAFDIIGINQYFGWYPWVQDFTLLEPFLYEMRDNYPGHALVMTEFGAEGRPDMADHPVQDKGSYAFQTDHVARTLDLVDRLPFMSGAIHWTLREFEIFPGWRGGALPGPGRNTRHHKGVLTYDGTRKPAWTALHDRFLRVPLYP